MSRKRIFILVLVLALVALVAVGSWIAGSSIQSPAEAAARTAPPEPSPILVPIEQRVLASEIVTRGTARYGLPRALGIAPSTLKANAGVIMTLPARNTQLQEGDVLLTVSGRPVFVLQGEKPTYRDIGPGMVGEDVRQLENALARLGFNPGTVDGIFDAQTDAAITAWYKKNGWDAFGPTNEQFINLRALEQELTNAQNEELSVKEAAAGAALAVNAARAQAESANKLATADVAAKTLVRNQVNADSESTGDLRLSTQSDLDAAQAALAAAQVEGDVKIQEALSAQQAARRQAKNTAATIARLAAELEAARGKIGAQVPADEIIFVPQLPVRIQEIQAAVGDSANGNIITVTNNQLAIDSSLPLDEAQLVKPGMAVAIDESELGIRANGTVARIAPSPGTDGADAYHIYFEVLVDKTSAPLEGISLRLTIPVQSTDTQVLAVPVSALSLAADGTTRVQVQRNNALEFIPVQAGLAADGFVQITPLQNTLQPGDLVVIGYENKP